MCLVAAASSVPNNQFFSICPSVEKFCFRISWLSIMVAFLMIHSIFVNNVRRVLLPPLLYMLGIQRYSRPQTTIDRLPFVWNPSLMSYNTPFKMFLLGMKMFHSVVLVPFIEEVQFRNLGFRFLTLWLCGQSSGISM